MPKETTLLGMQTFSLMHLKARQRPRPRLTKSGARCSRFRWRRRVRLERAGPGENFIEGEEEHACGLLRGVEAGGVL